MDKDNQKETYLMDCRAEPWWRVAIRWWGECLIGVRVVCERIEEEEEKKIRWRDLTWPSILYLRASSSLSKVYSLNHHGSCDNYII